MTKKYGNFLLTYLYITYVSDNPKFRQLYLTLNEKQEIEAIAVCILRK